MNTLKKIIEDLKAKKDIKEIDLTWCFGINQIDDEEANLLAQALKHNNTVTTINLSCHNIGDEGTKALAHILTNNKSITTVNLDSNNIGDEGAKALAQALANNSTVMKIDLSWNKIGSDGAKALADALKSNSTVTEIHLWNNQISNKGAKALVHALQHNNTLTIMNLWDNKIGDDLLENINKLLKKNVLQAEEFKGKPSIQEKQTQETEHNSETKIVNEHDQELAVISTVDALPKDVEVIPLGANVYPVENI
jgi:Ran GTPase-activating protein (RanGAP) involved in mRNA processing and transport